MSSCQRPHTSRLASASASASSRKWSKIHTLNRTFSCRSIMTLSEFDTKRCEKLVVQFIEKRRPPPHIRAEVDLSFRINGQSVEILEVRPNWRDKSKVQEHSIAKATYNKSK